MVAIAGLTLPADGAAPAKPATPVKPVVEDVTLQEVPRAVFTIDAKARNPFFPETRKVPTVLPDKPAVDPTVFVINGIAPRPPKPTVIINNRTFEPGEEAEVKVAGGSRVLIKCLEIKEDGAVIEVAKQRRELKVTIF